MTERMNSYGLLGSLGIDNPSADKQIIFRMEPSRSNKSNSALFIPARFIGSLTAGVLELIVFHPIDTMAKRLMTNKHIMIRTGVVSSTIQNFSTVVFRDAANKSSGQKYLSLFPGLGFATAYKLLQRIYKFGGHPIVKDWITTKHSGFFIRTFGERHSTTMMHGAAGSIIGLGEVVLLPLDILKVRSQTNPGTVVGKGFVNIVRAEGFSLYRGIGWTAARNAPGSFTLFGVAAGVKDYVFHLENFNDATFFQNFVASVFGVAASVLISQPLDVIKTRVQARPFESPKNGLQVIQKLYVREGASGFFKGLSVVGPKLIFSYTIAQTLIAYLEDHVHG